MTVFVAQWQTRYDPDAREMVARFPSVYKAERYGRLHFVLGNNADPYDVVQNMEDIKREMETFKHDDYLLLIGNPIIMGMCTAFAAKKVDGFVRFLQWSARENNYMPLHTTIF